MIGFVVALDTEADGVIYKAEITKKYTHCGKKIVEGKLFCQDFVLIISGIGKVNAALATQFIADKYPLSYIVNFGSAGGISGKTAPCEYYAIDKCCQYDFDLSALDDVPVGYIQDFDTVYFYPKTDKLSFLKKAGLASSDRFTEKSSDIATVLSMDCPVFDMEGGAIAQVATANGLPFYVFKGVTDVHGSKSDKNTFYENLRKVCDGFVGILERMLKN